MATVSRQTYFITIIVLIALFYFISNLWSVRKPCPKCTPCDECKKCTEETSSITNQTVQIIEPSEKPVIDEEFYPNAFPESITPQEQYHDVYKEFVKTIPPQFHPSNFVIAIVATANRPHYLHPMLRSLRQVLYWNPQNTILFQYGNGPAVNELVHKAGIRQIKRDVITKYGNLVLKEGAQHIAIHYKFIIEKVFEIYPDIQHFIIVEDDMLFAPDFLLYFSQTAQIAVEDPTVYAVSAYNDNGFFGLVKNDNMVLRTDFFVGLGWLVSRKLWFEEWRSKWPTNHWDHFLRLPYNRKNRHTLYPEVSRVFHSGYKGTHSDISWYERYFRNIQLNMNGFSPLGIAKEDYKKGKIRMNVRKDEEHTLDYLSPENYKKFMDYHINPNNENTIYIKSLKELTQHKNKNLIFFYESQSTYKNKEFETISRYFGIWHSYPVRTEYNGVVPLWWNDNYVFIIATYSSLYKAYKSYGTVLPLSGFDVEVEWKRPGPKLLLDIITSKRGQSCIEACKEQSGPESIVDLGYIGSELNNCRRLRKYFGCEKCESSMGYDQPAMDMESETCLVNSYAGGYRTTPEGAHPKTKRLCACFDEKKISIIKEEWEEMIINSKKQSVNPNLYNSS